MRADSEADFRDYVASRTDRMRRFAYLCCGDWHRGEDAVQTAFVRLYAKWRRIDEGTVDAYARRIVVNILIDQRRRRWFQRERTVDVVPDTVVTDCPGDRVETSVVVREALARLPGRQRLAVILRHWEDLSVEDTALVMRCSIGTVKSQTSRGLAALRAQLAESIRDSEGITS